MKYLYYFVFTSCIVFSLLSYQRAFAGANGFIAKKVRTGDNVVSLLKQSGFNDAERSQVLAQAPLLRNLFLTLDVNYLIRQANGQTELRLYEGQQDVVFIIRKTGKKIEAKRYRTSFKTTVARFDGNVQGSLMANIISKVNSNWVASRFMDAYIMDYNLNRGLSKGAKFWFTVEKKYDGAHFIRYGEVLQTSLQIRNSTIQKRYVRLDTGGGVFISESDLIKNRPFYSPVSYLRIASMFQPHRRHPITRRVQAHLGVDFELPAGSPVYAAKAGVIARYGYNRAAGNYVVLLHTNGVESSYNHLNRLQPKLYRGMKLNAGDKLGEVGCTGYCTKAHLHFAVRKGGRMVDPVKYLRPYPVFAENILHAKVAQF